VVNLDDRPAGGFALDTKPYVQHHPTFGYHYIPGMSMRLQRPGGGYYRIQINAAGVRSDREYTAAKPPHVTRIIVCGDSMSAGQFIDNVDRFSELLERRIPNLEVINLSLEGSGTDQQLLLYEHLGMTFEHDIVLLLPFLQNLRRNLVEARDAVDPRTRQMVLRPKPRFELVDGELILRNVPVPATMPADRAAERATETPNPGLARLKTRIAGLPGAAVWRRAIQQVIPWEPFPEYRQPTHPAWQLMSALIRRFKERAGARPLVVAPTFYSNYVRLRMGRAYWKRFSSLASVPGVYPVDLLPYFCQGTVADRMRAFQEPFDMHFSSIGHQLLAEAIEQELRSRRLLAATGAAG